MLSQRKIKELLKGHTIVLNDHDHKWYLLKDGQRVASVQSYTILSIVQAELVFAQQLQGV